MSNLAEKSGRAGPRTRDVGWSFLLIVLGGNALLLAVTVFFLQQGYRRVEDTARTNTDNLAHLISRDIESAYRAIDLALLGVVDEFASAHAPSDKEIDDWLGKVRSHYPELNALRIADASGLMVHGPSSAPSANKVNIADRDYFIRLRDDPGAGLQITDPLPGRVSGKSVIVFARRLNDRAGRFSGVAFGSIPVEYFAAKLSRLATGPDDAILIRNSALRLLARYPAAPGLSSGSTFRTPAFDAALKASPEKGRFDTGSASVDGVDRMFSYQRNADYGFYVNVGPARAQVFAEWRRQAVLFAGVAALFACATSLLAWRLRGSWHEQATVAAELERHNALFDAASRAARFGGWALDIPSMRLAWSDETYRIHRLEPGTPIAVETVIGAYAPWAQTQIRAALQDAIEQGVPWDFELELDFTSSHGQATWVRSVGQVEQAAGKTVRIFGAVIDISARKAAERAEKETRELLESAGRVAGFGGWSLALPSRALTWTDETYRIHGMEPGAPITLEDSIGFYAPEYRPAIAAALVACIERGTPWDLDLPLPKAAGQPIWVRAIGQREEIDGRPTRVFGAFFDISERKRFEQALIDSRTLLQQFLDHFPGMAYIKDEDLRVLMASKGFQSFLDIDPDGMIGRTTAELFPGAFGEKICADDRRVLAADAFEASETIEETLDGRVYETTKFVIRQNEARRLGGITVDVSSRVRGRERAKGLLLLSTLSGMLPEREYLREGLQIAESLTGSRIGFLHFVNEDQESIELVAWTDGALEGCKATYDRHYPIGQAGIWADCCRLHSPVVFNDYAGYAARKGLPSGHAPLDRLISVPVIEEGQIRMILGVGNKASTYDDFDVETVNLIGNDLWRIVRRLRAETALTERLAELTALNRKLEQAQNQLLQSEKMATVGQLAAGVAHELNNPIGFIQSNLGTLDSYVDDLLVVLEHAERCAEHCPDTARYDALRKITEEKDIAFLKSDIRQLLVESKDGADRVRRIVQNLKDFSHVSEDEWQWADLHAGLDSTLNLVWNEIKYKAEVERHYAKLPAVFCVASQINQVFMNLLVNAAQAIDAKGKISLSSGLVADAPPGAAKVWVEICDNGKGIPPENVGRIFEPFFTTKPVGMGTGLGLSLAWSIVEKHHGTLEVHSVPGEGTAFRIVLPVNGTLEPDGATT